MTEQQTSGSASSQLRQLMRDRLNQSLGLAAKAAGQQAGVLAQAVRQTGEELRQQGQEGQGKLADRIAQPIQRASGSLSQAEPQVSGDVKALKPKLTEQVSEVKAQTGEKLKDQTQNRTTAAGQSVTALTQGVRQVGEQLRSQGQQTPALVMDALAERIEPLGTYLSSTDPDKLRSDAAAYRQKAQSKLSSATDAVNRTQQSAAAKGTEAVKATAAKVRSQPALPIAGALSVVVLAARARKSRASEPSPDESVGTPSTAAVTASPEPADLQNLSRSQLREQATAAGLDVSPEMTKSELIGALQSQ